jgi:mRNA interferase HigB
MHWTVFCTSAWTARPPALSLFATSQYAKIIRVRILSKRRIREASEEHAEWAASLSTWYGIVKTAHWDRFQDVRQTLSNADSVGSCVVFNISHNKCRLIAYINYKTHKVFILTILTHAEYSKNRWKHDCHCD